MKRLNLILLAVTLFFSAGNLVGQTSYYIKTKELKESGYTYQCDNPYGDVTLYNKNNKYTYADCTLKDGSPIPDELSILLAEGIQSTIEDDNWTKPKSYSIVENALIPYKDKIRESGMSVTLIISPETGKVIEVYFNFIDEGGFGTVPVSVFRKMELELKKEIYFKITETGKKLNYCLISWTETY